MTSDLRNIRTDYQGGPLPENLEGIDPWEFFHLWMDEAIAAGGFEPTAMTLSTVGSDGMPDARVVLLKEVHHGGLVFYTDFGSRKGLQISENPLAHALFFWPASMRQIRARGRVARVDWAQANEYFQSRPLGSKVAAVASEQSHPIGSRAEMEEKFQRREQELGDDVPMPERWGGYRLEVDEFEFWQGLPSRLHDRAVFTRTADGWQATRLQP